MDRAKVTLCEMTDGCAPELDRGTAAQGRGWSAETTVDQALIRGLGTAFRVFVSGLVFCLEGGRRAQPGHVALMSVVNGQSNSHPLRDDRWLLAGVGSGVLLHRAGDGALRRRLIKLLSADWVPPSVSSSRGWSFV